MHITQVRAAGDKYVIVDADIGPGMRDKGIYYIRREVWDHLEAAGRIDSELELMRHADVVYDPVTNTITKNRWPDIEAAIAEMFE